MSFISNVELASKLLKIRDSNNNRLESARAAMAKAQEKKPDIDPKIVGLQKDLINLKEIKTGHRQDVPGEVANLMGVKNTSPMTNKRSLPKLFR